MPNTTTAAFRGSKATATKPPAYPLYDAEHDGVANPKRHQPSSSLSPSSAACCAIGCEDVASPDDSKYRKRSQQRQQQTVKAGILLSMALVALVLWMGTTTRVPNGGGSIVSRGTQQHRRRANNEVEQIHLGPGWPKVRKLYEPVKRRYIKKEKRAKGYRHHHKQHPHHDKHHVNKDDLWQDDEYYGGDQAADDGVEAGGYYGFEAQPHGKDKEKGHHSHQKQEKSAKPNDHQEQKQEHHGHHKNEKTEQVPDQHEEPKQEYQNQRKLQHTEKVPDKGNENAQHKSKETQPLDAIDLILKNEANYDRAIMDHRNEQGYQPPERIVAQRRRELEELNERMESNTNTSRLWARLKNCPILPGHGNTKNLAFDPKEEFVKYGSQFGVWEEFYNVSRPESKPMVWEREYDALERKDPTERETYVDYVHHAYDYPEKLTEPPTLGSYPRMRTFREIMDIWPQDNIDHPPETLYEDLQHFDWNNPQDMEAAVRFREAKVPFKVTNVPEIQNLTTKWTDDYLIRQFDTKDGGNGPRVQGRCMEGPSNFIPYHNRDLWNIDVLGIPPYRNNDLSFERYAKHMLYADRVGIHPSQPHFYWEIRITRDAPQQPWEEKCFVSRDLPSMAATSNNFIMFDASKQDGVQCRFGERGLTGAEHWDGGRNMVAMITGAKRYIMSPPRACKDLGVVSSMEHSSYRHSMLNFGHLELLNNATAEIPPGERDWLEFAGHAEAVSTVLKEGEILYIPTGWFHYIIGLQKSAQCNVRSGNDMVGDTVWGNYSYDLKENCYPGAPRRKAEDPSVLEAQQPLLFHGRATLDSKHSVAAAA